MIFLSPLTCMAQDKPATMTCEPADRPDIEVLVDEAGSDELLRPDNEIVMDEAEPGELLTPRAVAALLFVDRKTVFRWATSGKLASIRTPGGQRRYRKADVLAIRSGAYSDPKQQPAPVSAPADGDRGASRRAPEPSEDGRATAVVVEAVAIAMEAEATVTTEAVVQIAAAVTAAAEKAAEAAEPARGARAYAAEQAAQIIAREAARTAIRVQIQADIAAAQVARAAAVAVENLLASSADIEPAEMATLVARVVQAAAEATTVDTSHAATVVEAAVAAAAAGIASTASALEEAYDSEIAAVAAALHDLTTVTAQQAAIDTQGRAEHVASTAWEAAAALRLPRLDGDKA